MRPSPLPPRPWCRHFHLLSPPTRYPAVFRLRPRPPFLSPPPFTLAFPPKEMTLQSCLIAKMEGLEGLTSLTRLTLYDNQILTLNIPPSLSGLTYLDMSYNLIKSTAPVAMCPLVDEVRPWSFARRRVVRTFFLRTVSCVRAQFLPPPEFLLVLALFSWPVDKGTG